MSSPELIDFSDVEEGSDCDIIVNLTPSLTFPLLVSTPSAVCIVILVHHVMCLLGS